MSIKLQWTSCGKKMEAPDSAGGKWGKCPTCHSRIYVPLPQTDDEDELKLAPVDETEEQKKKELMQETFRLTQDILQERNVPEAAPASVGPVPEINEEKLKTHITRYLRQMVEGKLDDAQRTADQIVPHRRKAIAILDQLLKSHTPNPELEGIPRQVLASFIRNLRTRLL